MKPAIEQERKARGVGAMGAPAMQAVLVTALLAACGDNEPLTAPPPGDSWTLQIQSGANQVGAAGSALPAPITVQVRNRRSQPVRGVAIRWTAESGDSIRVHADRTDANGMVRATLWLGSRAGEHNAAAVAAGDTTIRVNFAAIALVQGAVEIALNPGDHGSGQADTVGVRLKPYRVLVRDHRKLPVANVVVRWYVLGRGLISAAEDTTDADGLAEVTHTLGTTAGNTVVMASVDGLVGSPVRFDARVLPGAAVRAVAEGGGQVGLVRNSLAPYRVRITDAWGNDITAPNVVWTVVSGNGTIVADPVKPATALHTLGLFDGLQTVLATVQNPPGFAPVLFTARAVSAAINVGYSYDYCYGTPAFWPSHREVDAGKSVAWFWDSCATTHSITFEDAPDSTVNSVAKAAGVHVRTFTGPARTIRYRCTLHSTSFTQGMVGTITIYVPVGDVVSRKSGSVP